MTVQDIKDIFDYLKTKDIPDDHKVYLGYYAIKKIRNKTHREVGPILKVSNVDYNDNAKKGSVLYMNNKEYRRILRSVERFAMQLRDSKWISVTKNAHRKSKNLLYNTY